MRDRPRPSHTPPTTATPAQRPGALPAPPRVALWLLERRVPQHEREFLVGDLLEAFHATALHGGGLRSARRRFWREAIAAALRHNDDPHSVPFSRGLMSDLGFDLALAARRLRRSPGFTFTASLTLSLGIGAACAIAAIARPALWGALPFREAGRIVTLRERFADGSRGRIGFATITDIARESPSLAQVAAVGMWAPTLTEENGSNRLSGLRVSSNFLQVMGVPVAHGRPFAPEEDRPGATTVVILGHDLWQHRFGGDSALVGRTVRLGDVDHRVIGILPPSYESVLVPGAQLLRPLGYADTSGSACRSCRHLQAVARLRDGVPPQAAVREVHAAFDRLRASYPDDYGSNGAVVTPLRDELVESTRAPLLALLGAAALLVLIALANVTNLFLARAIQRGGESTIRAALGASRWRLARGLIVEALLIAALGALFGVAIASATLGGLLALAPAAIPRLDQVRLDAPLLAGTAVLALLLGVVSGAVPTAFLRERGLRDRLAASSRTVARGAHDLVRRSLVVSELALALLLLCGAGILIQSVQRLLAVDLGFETEQRLELALSATGTRFPTDESVWQAWRSVHAAARAIPGVRAAALTSQLPLSGDFDSFGLRWEEEPPAGDTRGGDAFRFAVTSDYAAAMGLRITRGRFFDDTDRPGATPAVVINETLARQRFGDRDPLGARLRFGPPDSPLRTVVGVVHDVRHPSLDAEPAGQLYLPLEQNHFSDAYVRLVVHASVDPDVLVRALRSAIEGVDPGIPIAEVRTMSSLVDSASAQRRFAERLFQSFALAALSLAAVGIFGVFAGMVGERTREIGVRSALGATQHQILAHFLRQGGVLAGAGVALGVLGAVWLGDALTPLVYGVSPRDPRTIAVMAGGLGVVALLSTLLPAWRATHVDAMTALRAE